MKACYNCRQRRKRCDKSQPCCYRCSRDGEECLGYGRVLRWVDSPTAPAGTNKRRPSSISPEHRSPIRAALVDPLLNNLSDKSRRYIDHYSNVVCRDLVSVDQEQHNPFRKVVLLVNRYDYLRTIIVATSAMHFAAQHHHRGRQSRGALVDALSSRAKAISLLWATLQRDQVVNKEILLATIVFFINFDLIDSGRGEWQSHIQAASSLISSFLTTQQNPDCTLAPMTDAIAADCLTYQILGSTISAYGPGSAGFGMFGKKANVSSILHRHEAHSYHCCPPFILRTIMSASRLFELESSGADEQTRYQVARSLLQQARSFDVNKWVYSIRGLASDDDLATRLQMASAHRAACCLYIVLAVSNKDGGLPDEPNTGPDDFVDEIYACLESVPINHPLLKGLVWPTFMAGTQTNDPLRRQWFRGRLSAVLDHQLLGCPWGYVSTAISMLEEIWAGQAGQAGVPRGEQDPNWLQMLKSTGGGALIV